MPRTAPLNGSLIADPVEQRSCTFPGKSLGPAARPRAGCWLAGWFGDPRSTRRIDQINLPSVVVQDYWPLFSQRLGNRPSHAVLEVVVPMPKQHQSHTRSWSVTEQSCDWGD